MSKQNGKRYEAANKLLRREWMMGQRQRLAELRREKEAFDAHLEEAEKRFKELEELDEKIDAAEIAGETDGEE